MKRSTREPSFRAPQKSTRGPIYFFFEDDLLELERFEDDLLEDDCVAADFLDFVLDFLADDFFVGDVRPEDFLAPDDWLDFFEDDFDDFFEGTLPPSLRASERPIAIA